MTEGTKVADTAKGFFAKIFDRAKNNLSGAAWRESKVKAGFRSLGVAVGLGAMVDATFRSQSVNDDGIPQSRGMVGRSAEFVVGAALAGGSLLVGGGSR